MCLPTEPPAVGYGWGLSGHAGPILLRLTWSLKEVLNANTLKEALSQAGRRCVGQTPNSPETCLGAGQCLNVHGENDQVLCMQVPQGVPTSSLCVPAHPEAKLHECSGVSPNHRKVSQGLPGCCTLDQLRNEPPWEKQGQTPGPFYLSKLPEAV